MTLKNYFENASGTGVLSTADKNGHVDAAIYSRPHFMENGNPAFIMRNRLSHKNLETNSHAVYLFIENGKGYQGKRLYLRMIRQEKNTERIAALQRRKKDSQVNEDRFLVFFEVVKERPLVGDDHTEKQHK